MSGSQRSELQIKRAVKSLVSEMKQAPRVQAAVREEFQELVDLIESVEEKTRKDNFAFAPDGTRIQLKPMSLEKLLTRMSERVKEDRFESDRNSIELNSFVLQVFTTMLRKRQVPDEETYIRNMQLAIMGQLRSKMEKRRAMMLNVLESFGFMMFIVLLVVISLITSFIQDYVVDSDSSQFVAMKRFDRFCFAFFFCEMILRRWAMCSWGNYLTNHYNKVDCLVARCSRYYAHRFPHCVRCLLCASKLCAGSD